MQDGEKLSMAARYEITKKYAAAYAAAPKKGKTLLLDQVVEVTGWNRDHARQQLVARLKLGFSANRGHVPLTRLAPVLRIQPCHVRS